MKWSDKGGKLMLQDWKKRIGIDRNGLKRLGVNEQLGFAGWVLFLLGLLVFWPLLLFVRRRETSGKFNISVIQGSVWIVCLALLTLFVWLVDRQGLTWVRSILSRPYSLSLVQRFLLESILFVSRHAAWVWICGAVLSYVLTSWLVVKKKCGEE
jgi:hypothetical protein